MFSILLDGYLYIFTDLIFYDVTLIQKGYFHGSVLCTSPGPYLYTCSISEAARQLLKWLGLIWGGYSH